jgi:hypothetical protein
VVVWKSGGEDEGVYGRDVSGKKKTRTRNLLSSRRALCDPTLACPQRMINTNLKLPQPRDAAGPTHQSVPPAIRTGREPECRFPEAIRGDLRTPPPFLCAWIAAARGVCVGHGLEQEETKLSAYY